MTDMSRETLLGTMYLLALLSSGLGLYFVKDKKKRSIILAPLVVAFALLLAHGYLA